MEIAEIVVFDVDEKSEVGNLVLFIVTPVLCLRDLPVASLVAD